MKTVVFLGLHATFWIVASMCKPRYRHVTPRSKKYPVAQGKLLPWYPRSKYSSFPCATGYFSDRGVHEQTETRTCGATTEEVVCSIRKTTHKMKVVVAVVLQTDSLKVASMSKPRHGRVPPRPEKQPVAQGNCS